MTANMIRLNCSKCNSKLRLRLPVSKGRDLRCPACGEPVSLDHTPVAAAGSANSRSGLSRIGMIVGVVLCLVFFSAGLVMMLGSGRKEAASGETTDNAAVADAESAKPATAPERNTQSAATPLAFKPTTQTRPRQPSSSTSAAGTDASTRNSAVKDEFPRAGEVEAAKDDPLRPKNGPLDPVPDPVLGKAPVAPGGLAGIANTPVPVPVSPVLVHVPVLIPQPAPQGDLNVLIRTEPTLADFLVDHDGLPGLTGKLLVSLDAVPDTEVRVTLKPDTGLSLDRTELVFAANTNPLEQPVTVSGNGTAHFSPSSRIIRYVELTAESDELEAGGPARVPVQLAKRTRWEGIPGTSFVRRDETTGSHLDRGHWDITIGGALVSATAQSYELDYVEVLLPAGKRLRMFDDHYEVEDAIGAGTYSGAGTGIWK